MMNLFRSLLTDWRQWRAGNVRIAPRGVTGRVYAPRYVPVEETTTGVEYQSKSKGELVLKRRVYRVLTGVWEDLPELRTGL